MIQQKSWCLNFNHNRTNAPVRFCPSCGEIVNGEVPVQVCKEDVHAKRRREQNKYCVDCGKPLSGDHER